MAGAEGLAQRGRGTQLGLVRQYQIAARLMRQYQIAARLMRQGLVPRREFEIECSARLAVKLEV